MTGAQNDLEHVTRYAYNQVRRYGMSDAVGHVAFDVGDDAEFHTKPYSRRLAATIDAVRQR